MRIRPQRRFHPDCGLIVATKISSRVIFGDYIIFHIFIADHPEPVREDLRLSQRSGMASQPRLYI